MIEGLPKGIGERARRIMDAALMKHHFRCEDQTDNASCRKLNGRQLLRRDTKEACLWYPTDNAYELSGCERPEVGVGVDTVRTSPSCTHFSQPKDEPGGLAVRADESDLLATVERARTALTEDDVRHALVLSGGAYEEAKAAASYAEKVKASRELIKKFRAVQADALKVETYATIRLAEIVDAAQGRGEVSSRGRPKNVQPDDIFKLDEIGVDRRALHQARKLRDAELKAPGVVERAIAERIEAGLAPTRNAIRHAIGTRSASVEEKGEQLYETPIEAIRTLLALESFSATVKEPAVGKAAILRPLEAAGYEVMIADLVDRGIATRHGELQQVGDFLLSKASGSEGVDIVTNPPYDDLANAFAAHALREHKPRKMALLLNWNFAAGFDDPNRVFVMDENPPSRIYLFKRRLPMMHREGWDGPKATSQMNTAFFVWERNDDGTYGNGYPRLIRVDWKDYADAKPLPPGAGGNVAPMTFSRPVPDDEFARETPRKSLDERVSEERIRALDWVRGKGLFDAGAFRRGVAVRGSVAGALLADFETEGLIVTDGDGQWQAVA